MLTEMLGKGGQVCESARSGKIRCPLIVRPTSEDVITGEIFERLRTITPRWWLPQILNRGLGRRAFRQQVFRRLTIELWKNLPKYPQGFLPWREGSTQVDVIIRWENPPTTVFIEAKYLANLAGRTSGNDGSLGHPADQLIRNIRLGLWQTGWLAPSQLLPPSRRRFVMLLLAPAVGNPLVRRYRSPQEILSAIPRKPFHTEFPAGPFVGEFSYEMLIKILKDNRRWMQFIERQLADQVCDYLHFKLSSRHRMARDQQVFAADRLSLSQITCCSGPAEPIDFTDRGPRP